MIHGEAAGGGLRGRGAERAVLDEAVAAVRRGDSRVLVVRGVAGIGKTALLEDVVGAAGDVRVLRTIGVENEMELPFAALHQLLLPVLDRVDRLPGPQCAALSTVFGLDAGPVPDRFVVGLAALSLISDVAQDGPVIGVVDDAQWLDVASAQTLGFVARRLHAEGVALLFGTREPGEALRGLPELTLAGLPAADAHALLGSAVEFLLDEQVRDRIVAETGGNPLALLQLPRGLTAQQLAAGFDLLGPQTLPERIERSFLDQADRLPATTRMLLLVAAAEPAGDPALLWRAADRLGLPGAVDDVAGLLTVGQRVTFRHPLARSALYGSAPAADRRAAHAVLAEVTDPELDADRRAWHLAAAATGPDETVAAELARSAGRAQARAGYAAATALLQRSVALTRDPALRTGRALAAAGTAVQAGAFDTALALLTTVESSRPDPVQLAQADLLRAQAAFAQDRGSDAPPLLLRAAQALVGLDVRLARDTFLDAWSAALFAGQAARAGSLLEVSQVARTAPAAGDTERPSDLLLDGLALLMTEGRAEAMPLLRRAVGAFAGPEISAEEILRWGWLATAAAAATWDFESCRAAATRQVQHARAAGALAVLAVGVNVLGQVVALAGDFDEARSLVAEADAVREATGSRIAPYGALVLAGLRGRSSEALPLIEATIAQAGAEGQGTAVQYAHWARAVLLNAAGRYEEAATAARLASDDTPALFVAGWALSERVEAATRAGDHADAAGAYGRLREQTQDTVEGWGRGLESRCRALVSEGNSAEDAYREALEHLRGTRLRPELARAHLVYGEWLRRQGRRNDARTQLRQAHTMFLDIGMESFAERAKRELLASGEAVRVRPGAAPAPDALTPQERQIALLARDGLSNPEVGARLFLSPRTVEWHLRKVFSKLAISSRKELRAALAGTESDLGAV